MKQENPATSTLPAWKPPGNRSTPRRESQDVIDLSSSNEASGFGDEIADVESADRTGADISGNFSVGEKRARIGSRGFSELDSRSVKKLAVEMPEEEEEEGFGQSIPSRQAIVALPATPCTVVPPPTFSPSLGSCKQFWKAGDYEGATGGDWEVSAGNTKEDMLLIVHSFNENSWDC